ncbi:hypothetical protein E2C01_031726 [Portunus trituberculatus]|uniref:Uncharacterized protein n=1 Tax=Portunus trituberculatus TaxID=210409 RepID=A0A5B7EU84_PORTR|nr:hypothetical protein [Portunus trituberculatus]
MECNKLPFSDVTMGIRAVTTIARNANPYARHAAATEITSKNRWGSGAMVVNLKSLNGIVL